jgi:hypothetical protein
MKTKLTALAIASSIALSGVTAAQASAAGTKDTKTSSPGTVVKTKPLATASKKKVVRKVKTHFTIKAKAAGRRWS